MPEETYLSALPFFAACEAPVRVVAQEPTPRRILDLSACHTPLLEYEVGPDVVGDGTPVRMAASLGIVVRLEPETRWPEGVLEHLADYYLHSPTLEIPVEPFGILARSLRGGHGGALWEHYQEILGVHYYVDREGRVSLSERWVRAGHHFGRIDDSPEDLARSALWQRLAGYRDRLFVDNAPCATCPHFPGCGGFWLALGDEHEACAAWRRSLDPIREAWRATQEERTRETP